jgi:hypothetical protein
MLDTYLNNLSLVILLTVPLSDELEGKRISQPKIFYKHVSLVLVKYATESRISKKLCICVRECVRNLDLRVQVHPGELWVSKSAGAHGTRSLKISGCKRLCPKDLQVRAPAAPVPTHSLCVHTYIHFFLWLIAHGNCALAIRHVLNVRIEIDPYSWMALGLKIWVSKKQLKN